MKKLPLLLAASVFAAGSLLISCADSASDSIPAAALIFSQQNTESFYDSGDAKYVLMNVPYSKFYANEDISSGQMELDAVSSATTTKAASTTGLAKNTYNNKTYDGTSLIAVDMLGVTVPVKLTESAYEAMISKKVPEGTDMGAAESYAFQDLSEEPAAYKPCRYSKKGNYYFDSFTGAEKDTTGLSITDYTTTGGFGDYMLSLNGVLTAGTINGEAYSLYGVILSTSDNMNYALYILNNIWQGARVTNVELAWSVIGGQELKKAHGSSKDKFFQYAMNGKTLKNIKLLTSTGIYDIPANLKLDEYYTGSERCTAILDSNDAAKLNVTIPSVFTNPTVTVTYSSGHHQTACIADAVTPSNGSVTLSEAVDTEAHGTYTVTVKSDNYAPKVISIYGPVTASQITSLNEYIIKGNAYVQADSSLTKLNFFITKAHELLKRTDATTNEASELISELSCCITEAISKGITVEDNAFAAVAGSTKSRTYKGLFNPTILKPEYDSIWLKYITPITGEEAAAQTAAMLKASISGPTYGENLTEEQKAAGLFNCEFQPDENALLTFSVDSNGAYTMSDGTDTYTYSYLGISYMGANDNWHAYWPSIFEEGQTTSFECSVYKASVTNGNYTYVMLCPDTPEETYHIELRYGTDLNDLQIALSGKYAFWLAAGIPQNADAEMIENVIKLFVTENLGAE